MNCFLDRDGILNLDFGYVGTLSRFVWCEDIFSILLLLKSKGYNFVMVTNQSGLGRKYYTFTQFYDLSFYILNYLHERFSLDLEINFCPHHPFEFCKCRKPLPGMFLRYDITANDIMIGNSSSDMIAAAAAGVPNRWLVSSAPCVHCTHHFSSLGHLLGAIPFMLQ